MFPLLGSLVSGGASLLGNLLSSSSQEAIAQANLQQQIDASNRNFAAQQAAANLGQANWEQLFAANQAQAVRNENLQREFAQMGVRWRVADARAAGLHPLYALGAQTMGFSPVSIGSSSYEPRAPHFDAPQMAQGDFSLGRGISGMGQDIGRAIAAMQTPDERMASGIMQSQQLERGQLENDFLRAKIARITAPANQPGLSTGNDPFGVGDVLSGAMNKRNAAGAGGPRTGFQAGTTPAARLVQNPDESYTVYPSKEMEELASEGPYSYEQYLRQRLLPTFGTQSAIDAIMPTQDAGKGKVWEPTWGSWRQSGPWPDWVVRAVNTARQIRRNYGL